MRHRAKGMSDTELCAHDSPRIPVPASILLLLIRSGNHYNVICYEKKSLKFVVIVFFVITWV